MPQVDGYDVLQRLGEGGMGVVYKARHLGLKRLVALKMIRAGGQARADQLSRFRLEAEAVARLRHPNIIQIYDIGESDGLPFVALELLDGGGLDDRLAGNPQPRRMTADLVVTLARAIHVAHQAGIIHRDLKPTNVLYSSDGVPKITDFGLAKRIDSDDGHTQTGQIMGSPSYMAPEQARGDTKDIGPAADVYALGAILYEALTGRPPFKGETPMETVRQVIDHDPVTPSRLVPRLPRDLETICLKSLHKEPARRYGSAAAMADDLARYLHGEPILARRTAMLERGFKWAKRRPFKAAALAFAALLLILCSLGGFFYERNLREVERLAHQGFLALQTESNAAMLKATESIAKGDDTDARVVLATLRDKIQADPRLWELDAHATELLAQIDRREDEQRTRLAARGRYDEFIRLWNEALFNDTRFTGLDQAGNRDATRRSAEAALALFAAPGPDDSWTLATIPASLSEQETAIKEDCYELLLVLAEVEPTPDRGMLRLDQAARLRREPTRAYHLRRATCLARAGDPTGAERERGAANRLQPVTAFDHFLVGQERSRHDDPIAASQHFEAAIELQPDHFWAHCLLAQCRLRLNQPLQAKASLDTCIQRQPDSAWLYILRVFASSLLAASSRGAESERVFKVAEADYHRAMERLERKPNPELQYALLVNRAVLRLQHKDLADAETDLCAAIRLDGHPTPAYEALAKVYQGQGKPDEAIKQLSLAIERRPDLAALYRGRADVDLARKFPDPDQRARALRDLDRAIRLERPDNRVLALDHTNRGRLLALDHHNDDALRACDAAIRVVSDYAPAHLLRIDLLLQKKEYDAVIRSCDALLAYGKRSAKVAELRGLARARSGDYAGAIEDVTQAMASSHEDVNVLLARRGWLYIVSDAPRLALHDFEEVIRQDPSDGDAYNGRGSARLRLGEHREAVADAERALRLGKPSQELYYKAARVYELASRVAGAEVRKRGQDSVRLVTRYQDHAAFLLRQAVKQLPEGQRSAFWRDVVQMDPALMKLLRRIGSPDLAGPVRSGESRP